MIIKETLRVALIQADLVWENKLVNLDNFTRKIEATDNEVDLIVLPEMFTSGFSMDPEKLAEPQHGETLAWMQKMAKGKNCAITGSYIVCEKGLFFNRLVWVFPDGSFQTYDKRHLFRMGNEHEVYAPGKSRLTINYKGWKILPLICYDLRFPVWARNAENYDILIYVANFPAARAHVWKTLLLARAIENQSYVLGVNRIGSDASGVAHQGDSMIIDAKGQIQCSAAEYLEQTIVSDISFPILEKFRKSFPVLLDGDRFEIKE
jgi:omega-amidase